MTDLWLVDRSRYSAGTQTCMTSRYWEYHHGGYGIRTKKTSIPLATGVRVHAILSALMLAVWQSKPKKSKTGVVGYDRPMIREILKKHETKYRRICEARGFDDENAPDAKEIIQEQWNLMEGLVWAFVRLELPRVLDEFKLVSTEVEEEYVVGCSCGLSDGIGSFEEHKARSCEGIGQMSKPDLILERKSDGELGNHDFKTVGVISEPWTRQFNNSIQFLVGTLGAERRLERDITHYYVRGMVRGDRKKRYEKETAGFTGPKMQQSSLCYGTLIPANPPFSKKPIAKTDGKWYEKTAIHLLPDTGRPKEMSPQEWWVENLTEDFLNSLFTTIGPHPRPDEMKVGYFRGMIPHERAWQAKLWELYNFIEENPNDAQEIRYRIFELFPPSWQCNKWNRDCSFIPLCFGHPGAEEPLQMGIYTLRRPHHLAERVQMRERGIEVPQEGEGEDEDDE